MPPVAPITGFPYAESRCGPACAGVKWRNPKNKLIALATVAAFIAAPIAGVAADKEVQNAKRPCGCWANHRQVAIFVSGKGIGQPAAPVVTVNHAQVGQGVGVTFFTGQ